MDYSDLLSYFQTFIQSFPSYSNSDFYTSFIQYLKNIYYRDSYCTIPDVLKKFLENNVIDVSLYDTILLSQGIPQNVLDNMTISNKQVLLLTFLDYYKYKGTVYLLKDLSSQLSNEFNVYELYIDRQNGNWCFIPQLVYQSNPLSPLIDYSLSFEFVTSKAPYFYLTTDQLDTLWANNELILPIKSNLIFLDFYLNYDQNSSYNTLINNTILNYYKNYPINLVFYYGDATPSACSSSTSGSIFDLPNVYFTTDVMTWYRLYYYVYLKYYSSVYNIQPLILTPIITPTNNFPIDISQIPTIENEYNNIVTSSDATNFYNTWIKIPFLQYINQSQQVTVDILEQLLRNTNSPSVNQILDYIDNRISTSTYNKLITYNSILDELKYSFETFQNGQIYESYLTKILLNLPEIIVKDVESPSYIVIDTYKPFHTQIISDYELRIVSSDKLDTMYPEIQQSHRLTQENVSVIASSDIGKFQCIHQQLCQQLVISAPIYKLDYNHTDSEIIDDNNRYALTSENLSVLFVQDNHNILTSNPIFYYNWLKLLPITEVAPSPRLGQTSIVYNNLIYMFGGLSATTFLNDFWTYNISTNTWAQLTPTGGPPPFRFGHSAVVYDGIMYIFGGYNGSALNDLWTYNISTNTWTQLSPTGGPPTARSGHSAVVYDGIMYVFGGTDWVNNLNDLWSYNISTNTWAQLTPTTSPSARAQHSAVVYNGIMYIFGGSSDQILDELWSYDISTNAWAQLYPSCLISFGIPPSGRINHSASIFGSNMYIFGGGDWGNNNYNDLWKYNILSNSWLELTPNSIPSDTIPSPRRDFNNMITYSNMLVINGGYQYNTVQSNWVYYNDVWKYTIL